MKKKNKLLSKQKQNQWFNYNSNKEKTQEMEEMNLVLGINDI